MASYSWNQKFICTIRRHVTQSQKFTYSKDNKIPIWEIPDVYVTALEASDRLMDNIWVKWSHTCGCISVYISDTLLPNVKSWENQKKSAKISGGELWTSTSLVHPWVQFPDVWRCRVHLFKQLYTSITTMGIYRHRSGRRRVWVPEMNVLWCEICSSASEQKLNTSEDAAEAGKSVIIHRETSPELTRTERPLSQE